MAEVDIALSTALPRLTSSIKVRLATPERDFHYFGHYGTYDIPTTRRNMNENELRFDKWTSDILTTNFYRVIGQNLPTGQRSTHGQLYDS
jgi:hypothetical protein